MKVLLLNKTQGGGHQIFPVSGISGKLYGQATYRTDFNCPALEISLAEYERDKFDICGNTQFGHQWVPHFVPEILPPPDPLLAEHINVLRAMAKEAHLDASGSKVDIVARIREAQPGDRG